MKLYQNLQMVFLKFINLVMEKLVLVIVCLYKIILIEVISEKFIYKSSNIK